jgi:hypothetical protein
MCLNMQYLMTMSDMMVQSKFEFHLTCLDYLALHSQGSFTLYHVHYGSKSAKIKTLFAFCLLFVW